MTPKHFLCRLVGTRPTWPHDMTDDEAAIMSSHFEYLKGLLDEGRVLMAGPCFEDPPVGLVLVAAETEDDARSLMADDPSVARGLHTVDVAEMRVSLWAERR